MDKFEDEPLFQSSDFLENPFYQRKKLVRCSVTNAEGKKSLRMVELENFRLWEYLMTHKHGLKVEDLFLCLWVCEAEYKENSAVFTRAGEAEQVNHLVVELYDDQYGFTNTINRFVPAADTDDVMGILTSHIPKNMFNSRSCQIEVIKGRSIEQWRHSTDRPFLLGFDN